MAERITGMIAWGNGEPCPICKRPFDKPDTGHLLAHPEALARLEGERRSDAD